MLKLGAYLQWHHPRWRCFGWNTLCCPRVDTWVLCPVSGRACLCPRVCQGWDHRRPLPGLEPVVPRAGTSVHCPHPGHQGWRWEGPPPCLLPQGWITWHLWFLGVAAEHLRGGSHFSLSGSPVNACHLGRDSCHPVTAVPRQRSHVACPRLCPPLSQHTGVLTEGAV